MKAGSDLVCRICLTDVKPDKATSIEEYAKISDHNIQIKYIIEQCVSEMDLSISSNAMVCNSCNEALIDTYMFKLKCLQTEEKIYSYMDKNNIRLGDVINLSKVLKSDLGIEEIVLISSDTDCVVELSSDESEKEDAPVLIEQVEENLIFDAGASKKEQQRNEESPTFAACPIESYSCAKCSYTTQSKDSLEEHVHLRCRNRLSKYQCTHCHQPLSVRKRHLAQKVSKRKNRKRYICGLCEKQVTGKGKLRLHMLYVHSGSSLPYKCGFEHCQETFKRKCYFNLHIVKHVNYKPFMCQLCNRGFFNESQWDAHLEDDHDITLLC